MLFVTVDGLGSTDSAFGHEIATRRQVRTVVFVRHVVGLGRYDSASAHETATSVVFVLALRSWTITPAVVATSQGLTVTQLADVWTLLSCVPDA